MFDNILSNAAKYSAGDLTVTLTPDGAVTFANHAPNLSCVQANQLVDRFWRTARTFAGRAVFSQPRMSPEKMIGLSFAAPAAKLYEVFGQAVGGDRG